MHNYYPLLLVGGIIGTISLLLLIAYGLVKDKKEAMGFERNMKDSEIMQRLVKYAAPYKKEFIFRGLSHAVFDRLQHHFPADCRSD